jgi:hypothetical protein
MPPLNNLIAPTMHPTTTTSTAVRQEVDQHDHPQRSKERKNISERGHSLPALFSTAGAVSVSVVVRAVQCSTVQWREE